MGTRVIPRRAGHQPPGNAVAQRHLTVAQVGFAGVAQGGEAFAEVDLHVAHAPQRRLRRGHPQRGNGGKVLGIAQHVRVAINQPGQDGDAGQADDFRVPRGLRCHRGRGAHFADAVAFDHNGVVGQHVAAADIEESLGLQHHDFLGRFLRAARPRQAGERHQQHQQASRHFRPPR